MAAVLELSLHRTKISKRDAIAGKRKKLLISHLGRRRLSANAALPLHRANCT
jgi:hypothetical protein